MASKVISVQKANYIINEHLERFRYPKPIYYKSCYKKWIILSTPAPIYNNKNGVYIYDVSNNFWRLFCKYPRSLKLKKYQHVLDEQNSTLYIFDSKFKNVAALNLKTKCWDIQTFTIESLPTTQLKQCNFIYFISPTNEIHAVSNNGYHIKYNKTDNSFIRLPCYDVTHNNLYKMIYVKSMGQLLMFRTFDAKIIYCQFSKTSYVWKEYPLKLQISSKSLKYTVSLIHDHILTIYHNSNDMNIGYKMYCIDLRYRKIVKLNWVLPKSSLHSLKYLIDSHDGMIHCFKKSQHVEWRNQLAPQQWRQEYRNTFDKLIVTAYVYHVQSFRDMNIPSCLSQLIWLYYPGYLTYI